MKEGKRSTFLQNKTYKDKIYNCFLLFEILLMIAEPAISSYYKVKEYIGRLQYIGISS
jgi:hypothetical protein